MVRGPRPVPTHLKLLRGNPGHEKLNTDEPQPQQAPDIPPAPDWLTGYAFDEWDRIVTELYRLRLLTVVDIQPLAAYCQAYKRWRMAEEALERMGEKDLMTHGLILKGRSGNAVENPLAITAHKAAMAMVRYASEFGLTPAARSRISAADAIGTTAKKFDGLLA